MLQQAIQVVVTTVWALFASPIAGGITPQGWCGLGAGLAGLQFLVAVVLLLETTDRGLSVYQEAGSEDHSPQIDLEADSVTKPTINVCKERPKLDFVNCAKALEVRHGTLRRKARMAA